MHVDLDAFFASVEVLDDPALRGLPLAVGGAGERGVIASATYEARRYGVRSGMSSIIARRHCPELIIRPGRFDRYEEYSRRFRALVEDLTPRVEPIGLDELFADLRGLHRLGIRPLDGARALRRRIRDELSLECGIGLARNKLFAKLGSRRAKPRVAAEGVTPGPGVVVVDRVTEARWLDELGVEALWGVGPATAERLRRVGLRRVRDLASVDASDLAGVVGPAMAVTLAAFARGEDPREVMVDRAPKSIGHDQTFAVSLRGREEVAAAIRHHAGVVARALRQEGVVARTISIQIRFDDRTSVSRSQTLPFGVDDATGLAAVGEALAASVPLGQAVRLIGLYGSGLVARVRNAVQLALDVDEPGEGRGGAVEASRVRQAAGEALRDALDEIRERFGSDAVATGADLGEEGLRVARRRERAFGPDQ